MRIPFTIAAVWTALTFSAAGQASFKLTQTQDSCKNAFAVLMASASPNKASLWSEVRWIAHGDKEKWEVVDQYEPGVVKKLSLHEYDTKFFPGGTAYVAHCGHGGTCNSLAKAWFDKYPNRYSTAVYCGSAPPAIVNPRKPSQ
jgi:hypothetical protein